MIRLVSMAMTTTNSCRILDLCCCILVLLNTCAAAYLCCKPDLRASTYAEGSSRENTQGEGDQHTHTRTHKHSHIHTHTHTHGRPAGLRTIQYTYSYNLAAYIFDLTKIFRSEINPKWRGKVCHFPPHPPVHSAVARLHNE